MDPPPAQRARQTSETAPRRFGRQESYDMLYDESTSDAIRNRAMQGRASASLPLEGPELRGRGHGPAYAIWLFL